MTAYSSTAGSTVPKIESNDLSLADVYKDFYTVPDFQREFVWTTENVERLLEDTFDDFYDEQGRLIETTEYFIGSIVTCRDGVGTFQLIDGQQRLTTIFLIFCAIRDHLRALRAQPPEQLGGFIRASSMDPRTGEDVSRYRLVLQYEDSHGVLEKVASATMPVDQIPAATASVRNILAAYGAIREYIGVRLQDDPGQIKRFLVALSYRVKLIRVVTPNLSHALKVFETINDRGVSLNSMDLLKNLLFIKTQAEAYPTLKKRWKALIDNLDRCREKPLRFLRYYVMSHYELDWSKGLREDQIYKWFVDNSSVCGIDSDPLGFVDQLVAQSNAYANYLARKDARGTPNRYLQNIASLSGVARQHFILLLAGQHLAPELFDELCRELENLFFCYVIVREGSKTLERNFARWSAELRRVSTPEELAGFIESHFLPEMADRSEAFDFAFQQLSLSRIQQYRMRYILAKLTQHVEEQAWGNPAAYADLGRYLDGSVHIEHIQPRRPTEEAQAQIEKPAEYEAYAGKLGNLTLLEKTINSSVSNGPYRLKKEGYAQSAFLLTKSLVERPGVGGNTQLNRAVKDLLQFETWSCRAIDDRQAMLTRLARRVWLPALDELTEAG